MCPTRSQNLQQPSLQIQACLGSHWCAGVMYTRMVIGKTLPSPVLALGLCTNLCCVVIVSCQPSGCFPHRGAKSRHIHFLLGPLLGASHTLTTMVGSPWSLLTASHTLAFSTLPQIGGTIIQDILSRRKDSSAEGPGPLLTLRIWKARLLPSLFSQLFREKEGRGRYVGRGILPPNTRHSEAPV